MKRKVKIITTLLILYWGLVIAPNWIKMYDEELWITSFKLISSLLRWWVLYMGLRWAKWKMSVLIPILLTMGYASIDVLYKVIGMFNPLPEDHWYWIFLAVSIGMVFYLNRRRLDFKYAKTVEYDPKAMMLLAYRPPKSIIEVIPCILTLSPYGSYKLITYGKELGFSKKTSQLTVKNFVNDGNYKFSKCELSQERIWNILEKYQEIIDNAPKTRGWKRFFVKTKKDYHILLNNCYQFKEFKEYPE